MRTTFALATLLGLAMATPQPTLVAKARRQDSPDPGPLVGEPDVIDLATYPLALGGAIDMAAQAEGLLPASTAVGAPETTEAPNLAERADAKALLERAPTRLTFNIKNQMGADVSTRHARNAGAPAPVAGNVSPGVIKNGATGSFVVPQNWAGNVAFVKRMSGQTREIVGDESLVEAAFLSGVIGINISYVSGFSVPLVCACAENNRYVVGCNKDLWNLGTCPNNNGKGSCRNPTRSNGATAPTAFFRPCRGGAYTFPADNGAMAQDICKGGTINCCIGSSCPKSLKQPA